MGLIAFSGRQRSVHSRRREEQSELHYATKEMIVFSGRQGGVHDEMIAMQQGK